jgi:hypothetical protein
MQFAYISRYTIDASVSRRRHQRCRLLALSELQHNNHHHTINWRVRVTAPSELNALLSVAVVQNQMSVHVVDYMDVAVVDDWDDPNGLVGP